jgi:hypothetical protein
MHALNEWLLTSARAAIHLPTRTAVVADVHLGYAEARQRDGDAVPTVSVSAALAPLAAALGKQNVTRLVIAGDLFEAGATPALVSDLVAWSKRERIELAAIVPGNHDRRITTDTRLPVCSAFFQLGDWHIAHGDGELPAGRVVQGHEHPLMRWGNGLTAPCYLVAERHIVLPAYSADAAGVNVLHSDRWSEYRCGAIAGADVLDFGKLRDIRPQPRGSGRGSTKSRFATHRYR